MDATLSAARAPLLSPLHPCAALCGLSDSRILEDRRHSVHVKTKRDGSEYRAALSIQNVLIILTIAIIPFKSHHDEVSTFYDIPRGICKKDMCGMNISGLSCFGAAF